MKKNIPAVTIAGMFFFSACVLADQLALVTDLFEKTEWSFCLRECRRAVLANTEPMEKFQLLGAMSAERLGDDHRDISQTLKTIMDENRDPQVSAIAAYELGRIQWQMDHPEAAFNSLTYSFQTTTNKSLFLRSSCSIYLLLKDAPEIKDGHEEIVNQVSTTRDQWYGALFKECAKPDPEKDKPHAPNWIVRFYRSQISPAIGNRCTLEPSCSEYFHLAHEHHGLKAFPMIADRFFREPEVSSKKEDPVVTESGQIRYRDPLEDHNFWMKKK